MQSVKIGILGLGTVGSGTVNVLTRNSREISRRAGRDIEIYRAADRDLDKPKGCDTSAINLTDDAFDIINDPDIQIVVELIGGTGVAKELVIKAIENGKHVVTANKALIAMHGNELFELAQERGVTISFEAAVAGGIPIIKAMREGLAGNRIEWLAGIINGTGNFILTEMREKGILPLCIDIETAAVCDLACPFCFREYYATPDKLINADFCYNLIDQAAELKVPSIKLACIL